MKSSESAIYNIFVFVKGKAWGNNEPVHQYN